MSDQQPILYLMSKEDQLKENQDAWLALNAKGYDVYSPICESYNIEERRQIKNGQMVVNYHKNPIYPEIDYVARDLRLIERFMHHDTCLNCAAECEENSRCDEYNDRKYDSGIVGVVCPSAYHRCSNPAECCDPPNCVDCQEFVWQSKGAEQEYTWMKAHHILVIALETALTVPFEQWEEHAL